MTTATRKQTPAKEPCAVCFSRMDYVSLGECGHRLCCGSCSFRLRQLHHDDKCVVCKTKLAVVFITSPVDSRSFGELNQLLKPEGGLVTTTTKLLLPDASQSGIFFTDACAAFQQEMDAVRSISCCDRAFPSTQQLTKHLEQDHRHRMCQLCLDNRGLFFQEHARLTPAQLKQHTQQEHPACKFCRNRAFYNADALYKHLAEQHEKCHVCAKLQDGNNNQTTVDYFNDYAALEEHFRGEHFLCERAECRRVHFVNVFASEVEWLNHDRLAHSSGDKNSKGSRITFEFAYKDQSHAALEARRRDEELVSGLSSSTMAVSSLSSTTMAVSAEDFPPLSSGGAGPATTTTTTTRAVGGGTFKQKTQQQRKTISSAADFPPLRGGGGAAQAKPAAAPLFAPPPRRPLSAPLPPPSASSDFPSLPSSSSSSVVARPAAPSVQSEHDFPALAPPKNNHGSLRLSRDEVRQLAFGPTKAQQKAGVATSVVGVKLVGKKSVDDNDDDKKKLQRQQQKKKQDLVSLAVKKQ